MLIKKVLYVLFLMNIVIQYSTTEHIIVLRKWVQFTGKNPHNHQECQKQYMDFKNPCPPECTQISEHMNVAVAHFLEGEEKR